ncbi:MAG: PadR family transcriptional regulator [Halobacteriaceae archaeon]
MGKWLHSGLRRDVRVVVASLGRPTDRACKTALESHYGERVTPKTFHGALSALVDAGHLVRETDGIQDRYALTPAGEQSLRAHHDWAQECLAESE